MTVLTFLARFDLHRRVEKALSSQFVMDDVASAKECLQMARLAPYEGVLIDSDSLIFVNVLALVKLLRHESSDTSIFVFSRCLDLEQRLSLFEAGVDYCVCEPFFASEMAVRLGLSVRCVRRRRIWGHPARQMCPVSQGVGRDPIADNSSWEPDLSLHFSSSVEDQAATSRL